MFDEIEFLDDWQPPHLYSDQEIVDDNHHSLFYSWLAGYEEEQKQIIRSLAVRMSLRTRY